MLARCRTRKWRFKVVVWKLTCSTATNAALIWVIKVSTSDSQSLDTARLFLALCVRITNSKQVQLWYTNIIKKLEKLVNATRAGIELKNKRKNSRGFFFFNVFLHPLRNPRQRKNKSFIGLQLVVMWVNPLGRCLAHVGNKSNINSSFQANKPLILNFAGR